MLAETERLRVRSKNWRSSPDGQATYREAVGVEDDPLTRQIIGAAIEVHRQLGPGCLESTYEECLCIELTALSRPFERQLPLPIVYKSTKILGAYKPDLLVDGAVIVELKTIDRILQVHEAQLLTYLRLSGLERGLLINFNSVQLTQGIRRLNKSIPSPISPISPTCPFPSEVAIAMPEQRA